MEVLKHGNLYETKEISVGISVCNNCSCKFSYTGDDLIIEFPNEPLTLMPRIEKYVICPECKKRKEIY